MALFLALAWWPGVGSAAPIADFDEWRYRHAEEVAAFVEYLRQQGVTDVPPLEQVLGTATEWRNCKGGKEFAVPPVLPSKAGQTDEQRLKHWRAAADTLKLYAELRSKGIIASDTAIVSAYRPPSMATCVGSTITSAHSTAFAIDIVGSSRTSDALCRLYQSEGAARKLGLSKYPTGRIHLDVTKHRTWGRDCTCETSYCAPCAKSRGKKC